MPCSSNVLGICLVNKPAKMEMQILRVKKDSIVFVRLESLSTAGYLWTYSIEDSSIVAVEKKANEFSKAHPKPGDSGLEVFAVKGLGQGATKIFFTQKRSWEKDSEAIKNTSYIIEVDE